MKQDNWKAIREEEKILHTEKLKDLKTCLTKQLSCDHKFTKMSIGYFCKKCGLYTGASTKLNEIIEEILITELPKEK